MQRICLMCGASTIITSKDITSPKLLDGLQTHYRLRYIARYCVYIMVTMNIFLFYNVEQ